MLVPGDGCAALLKPWAGVSSSCWEQLLVGIREGVKPLAGMAPVMTPLLSPVPAAAALLEHTAGPGTASGAAPLKDFATSS